MKTTKIDKIRQGRRVAYMPIILGVSLIVAVLTLTMTTIALASTQ